MSAPYEHGAAVLLREGSPVYAVPLDERGRLRPLGGDTEMVVWRMRDGDEIRLQGRPADRQRWPVLWSWCLRRKGADELAATMTAGIKPDGVAPHRRYDVERVRLLGVPLGWKVVKRER